MNDTVRQITLLLGEVLQLGDRVDGLDGETPLLGGIPELDSMAVVTVITTIEERFDITVEDDEVSAELFETIGSLAAYVDQKLAS